MRIDSRLLITFFSVKCWTVGADRYYYQYSLERRKQNAKVISAISSNPYR